MLGGAVWTVVQVPRLKGKLGDTNFSLHRIRLLATQTEQAKLSTFCHELMHAVMWTLGDHTDDAPNEKQADLYGAMLHQFLTTKVD